MRRRDVIEGLERVIAEEVNVAADVAAWAQVIAGMGATAQDLTDAFDRLRRTLTEDAELIALVIGALAAVEDETHGMTLDELLGDDVADLIRANRLK